MPEYKDMIKAAYDKGHTIGMHTYSHDYAKVYASVDAYFQDLDQIGQMVQEEIGYVPCFIRFPGGCIVQYCVKEIYSRNHVHACAGSTKPWISVL